LQHGDLAACNLQSASTPCAFSARAGTLSGAPKVRAMEIIDELEPHDGPYGGAVAMSILRQHGPPVSALANHGLERPNRLLQPAPGIVADSVPETRSGRDPQQTMVLLRALEIAETQL